MANQYRLGNRQNEERSPYRDAIYLRLFGSNISIIPTTTTYNALEGNNTSHFINRGQTGVAPVVGSDYQRSGAVVENSSNANSISSFNDGINTTTTGTRNDELCRANSSFKRSRSPDPFTRGETSNQGSQIDGRFNRRRTLPPPFHPYQDNVNNMSSLPTTTFWDHFIMDEDADVDAGLSSTTTTTQSEINSSLGGPAGFFRDNDSSRYNFPTRSLDSLSRLRRQEDPWTNLLRGRHDPSPTSASFLYPSAATRGAASSSSQGTSFSQNGDNNNNLDFFDTYIQQGMDDAYVESTTNVQQHVRLLTEGRVNRIPSPTIVPVWPSSFVPQRQPITTLDPSSSNYQLNPSPSLSGSGFTIAAQTIQYIQTGSGLPRSETVARSSGSYHNFISTSHEISIERDMLRIEDQREYLLLDYWATQNRILHSQERIDWITNSEDWLDEMIEAGLREEEILMYIQQETYQPTSEETSTMNQTCTICQEDYIDGECIGRLDCNHIYHLDCIKQWLEVKNVCPICKETALKIYEDDDESEDE